MTLTDAQGFTIEDLEAMPDDGRRYELIGGSIVVNPAPTPRHQQASLELAVRLRDAAPPGHRVYTAPIDLDLPGGQRVEPDLVVVPAGSVGKKRVALPVLLVVELISPTNPLLDTLIKRAVYAEAGIPHYWLLDTREGHERFTALRLAGDDYETIDDSTETVETTEPVAVTATLAELLDPPSP